jgi:signal transduction histidine kinase/CheY-like chemotaxis protein
MDQVLREKRAVIGEVRRGQIAGPAIPVRVPVIQDGVVQYVITAALRPDRIREILARQDVPKGWVITVADPANQRVAYSPDHEQFYGKRITPSLERVMGVAAAEGNGIAVTAEGVESVAGFTKLPRWGLSVIVGAPTSLLHKAFGKALAVYAAGLLLSLLACLLAAAAISRRIVGGIQDLQRQAGDLGQGQAVKARSHGIAEIDHLAQSLETASKDRLAVEQQRETLLASLNRSLASLRVALDQAQEAARAKDHFLAMLGHELRNPLAPIVSTLDLMDVKGGEVYLRERQILRRQVAHMHRLVDDLLDVSRIAQGKLTLAKCPVLVNALVERAFESVSASHGGRQATLSVALPEEDVWVQGDETRLLQVILNLLGNALRHSPDAPISLSLSASGSAAIIEVSDAGTGMSGQMLEKIFVPFYQGPQSIARSAGGLGLGLAIARSIIDMHGGCITAHSDGLGQGSSFRIELPLESEGAPVSQQSMTSTPARQQRALRILIVDDNIDAATTMAEALAATGHDVRVSHSAAAALTLLSNFRPDVGILDIGLPDTDGFSLAQRLRAGGQAQDAVLIAITGYGQPEDARRALQAGFDLHLTKPVAIEVLLHQIEHLVKTPSQADRVSSD